MENLYRTLSYFLPKRLVFFATVRGIAWATCNPPTTIVPELTAMEALKRVDEWSA